MLSFLFYFFFLFLDSFSSNWLVLMFLFFLLFPFFFYFSFSVTFLSKNSLICLDSYSFLMVVLSVLIILLSLISSFNFFYMSNFILFTSSLMVLLFFLLLTFLVNNFFLFFFFFESCLLPILFLVIGWGFKIERLSSGLYMYFYTLIGSLPLFFSLIFLFTKNFTQNLNFINFSKLNVIIYFFLLISFLIKMPMYFFHSWLPKAHVEAPVAGSMILAGVLLKLGGYGIFRLMFILKNFSFLNSYFLYISLWGGILSSFISIRQFDMKSLIAYSSVSHMSLVISSFLTLYPLSFSGSFFLMVSHGLNSSGLFFLVNVVYERSHSRSMFLNKGLMSFFPSLSMWWFIFCSFNMSAPPSLNLISEVLLMNLIVSYSFFTVFFFMLMSFLSAVYSLFLFSFLNHGFVFSSLIFLNCCCLREFYILMVHFLPMMISFLSLEFYF